MSATIPSNRYDLSPCFAVSGHDKDIWTGYEKICQELSRVMCEKRILCVDCYPGVNDAELLTALKLHFPEAQVIESRSVFYDPDVLTAKIKPHLTDDRVRGVMFYGQLTDLMDPERLENARNETRNFSGSLLLIYGFGASLIHPGDVLVYADLARWEIQLRYRRGMPNYNCNNSSEEILRKYKRGFFVEWRVADRHKSTLYNRMDYYLDTNTANDPKMITGTALTDGLRQIVSHPFRLVPYFDPGIWGGQWMKEHFHLDPSAPNYAWSFDGVPEENSLFFSYGGKRIETPAMNLTKYLPREFLGEKTFSRFGAEFPIRFDMLDTMGGQNLSLQVHPDTEYIKTHFGMSYTQDESYYLLDAEEGSVVYLGLKEGIDPQEMFRELEIAQTGARPFDAERFINSVPAKKHDHFLIPGGTVHCSGKGCMVLEISATPYIFTFKLWDWDRVDLNGMPRPIHIEDGKQVIRFNRDTKWVSENLVNRFRTVSKDEDYQQIHTGLHELEFIETNLYITARQAVIRCDGEFSILNLVEGTEAIIQSPDERFEPYTVHYAETFILPAAAGDFTISPAKPGEEIRVIRANVRF